jgi:hypothetical protein
MIIDIGSIAGNFLLVPELVYQDMILEEEESKLIYDIFLRLNSLTVIVETIAHQSAASCHDVGQLKIEEDASRLSCQ